MEKGDKSDLLPLIQRTGKGRQIIKHSMYRYLCVKNAISNVRI